MPIKDRERLLAYHRKYNKTYRKRASIARKLKLKQAARLRKDLLYAWISDLKEKTPCIKCGNKYPAPAMDFHHRDAKTANIATMVHSGLSRRRIEKEIASCDIICSNCHRVLTFGARSGTGIT